MEAKGVSELKLFQPEELRILQGKPIPRHVAIIPDGNRRWAKKQGLLSTFGHEKGVDVVDQLVQAAIELEIKMITIYTFSTENWERPKVEVNFLMNLLERFLTATESRMVAHGVRLQSLGDLGPLPARITEQLQKTVERTGRGDKLQLNLALNYGGRDEIRRAVQKIAKDCREGYLQDSMIKEETIAAYLDTSPLGDPELVIRTGGEIRISNFLLWQISYAELYFTDVLWPDFTPKHLLSAVSEYQSRTKRRGR